FVGTSRTRRRKGGLQPPREPTNTARCPPVRAGVHRDGGGFLVRAHFISRTETYTGEGRRVTSWVPRPRPRRRKREPRGTPRLASYSDGCHLTVQGARA